ncbi:maleylpyruvate isomerase family mycothiol-dependent enzyme [Nocardioides gansuensis]|nr:maleylpyruvate isomerase family mycothiol-dependent enzyme [Nocardioides gansuensis]
MTPAVADLVRAERLAFIDTLESLSAEQWLAPSLCDAWRVLDVAAHVAWAPVLRPLPATGRLVRNGFSMNRMIASSAVEWSRRGRRAILEQLRDNAESGARPVGMPVVAALADAVVHGLDVRRPLGIAHDPPEGALEPLARSALAIPWPMNTVIGGSARKRVAGITLVATDAEWRHGTGPEVRASTEAILLLLHGRGRALTPAELTGEGAERLHAADGSGSAVE